MFYFFILLFLTVTFLLFFPLKFRIFLKNNVFHFKFKILFFWLDFKGKKFSFFNRFKQKKDEKPKVKKKKNNKVAEDKKIAIKDHKKFIIMVLLGAKLFFESVSSFRLKIRVSASDSFKVALRYFCVCSVVSFLVSRVLKSKQNKGRVFIIPDFSCSSAGPLEFDFIFSISLFNAFRTFLEILFKFSKEGVFYEQRTT